MREDGRGRSGAPLGGVGDGVSIFIAKKSVLGVSDEGWNMIQKRSRTRSVIRQKRAEEDTRWARRPKNHDDGRNEQIVAGVEEALDRCDSRRRRGVDRLLGVGVERRGQLGQLRVSLR